MCPRQTSVALSPPLCFPLAAWHGIQPAAKEADAFLSLPWSRICRLLACWLLLGQCLCPSLEGVGSLKNNAEQHKPRDRRTEEEVERGGARALIVH